MPALRRSEMRYRYSWNAMREDDPRMTGEPDATLLNRGEGYEVLHFVNRYCALRTWKPGPAANTATALKVERMVHAAPGTLRSRQNIAAWIQANWATFAG